MTRLLNARILIAAATIVFVGALAASATGAFFSDTETSTGNTFAAGDIDLQIDNESYVTSTSTGALIASPANSWAMSNLTNQLFFSFTDVKPGDIGEDTISVHVGSNNAWACMAANITATPENTLVDPETDAGDVGPALGNNGELQNFLNFTFWKDDGDNVLETGETVIGALTGTAGTIFNGAWLPLADTSSSSSVALVGNSTNYIGKAWCFGTLTATPIAQDGLGKTGTNGPLVRGTGVSCDGSGNNNAAQTDGISVDVSFQAVQARNNASFLCSSLAPLGGPVVGPENVVITTDELATTTLALLAEPFSWFFYNDTNDTVMPIDQFSGTGGQNHMESVAGEAGAKMVLDSGVDPRYNIATARFTDLLNTISSLKFRVYDAVADSDTPFLGFNIDFATTTLAVGYQGRLTMQPGTGGNPALPAATWTTVDAINGGTAMYTWSKYDRGPDLNLGTVADNNTWPDGNTNQYRSWSSILAAFPNAKLLSPGSFLGVRTGQPGPAGATNFVSSIEFDGTTYDFEI